jgi:hypothetical protein
MLRSRIAIVTVALGLAAMIAPTRAADNTPFKVKPGLWEMTADTERSVSRRSRPRCSRA